jgi:Ca2+-binding RTX toxin-like protein
LTAGAFTVTANALDEFGQVDDTATYRVSIAATGLMPDPMDPGKMSLFVGGTPGNDSISIVAALRGQVQVKVNGKSQGKFTVTGGLFVYGDAGNDTLSVGTSIKLPALLDGGRGNDILLGGSGNDILLGGPGNDMLFGRASRDLLIGGGGADALFAEFKGDILIGGATAFDADYQSLHSIRAEWTSVRKYRTRTANLRGSGNGSGANRAVRLVTTGPKATIVDDGANDLLGGGDGQDWFFAKPSGTGKDRVVGHQAGELISARAEHDDRPASIRGVFR